jgi:predicted transposase YbfD/YdcC
MGAPDSEPARWTPCPFNLLNGRACGFRGQAKSNSRLVLGQEAVDDKTSETTTIPLLLEKLAAGRSLEGTVVTIAAFDVCNPQFAKSIRDAGADYLLAVKGNQPTLQADIEAAFDADDRTRSKSSSISTRVTAASKPAPSRCCAKSIGSTATGAFPAKSASSTPRAGLTSFPAPPQPGFIPAAAGHFPPSAPSAPSASSPDPTLARRTSCRQR